MLGEELQELKGRICGHTASCACSNEELTAGIIVKWRDAGFSALPDHSLRRYYSWQLGELGKLSDQLSLNDASQDILLKLIDHLVATYPDLCDLLLPAPVAYLHRAQQQQFCYLKGSKTPANGTVLWLRTSLPELYGAGSFQRLKYLDEVSSTIRPHIGDEPHLIGLLISLNLNYLGFYHHLCGTWERLDDADLLRKQAEIITMPVRADLVFDHRWPSLKELLAGWLKEKAELSKCPNTTQHKLHLNILVAHLAFLIRLLKEEGATASVSLTELLNQVSGCIRTKKQPAISEGSLAKEFYGTDQYTAARVRDLLQRMVNNINRRFFPLAAGFVISAMLRLLS